MGAEGGPFPSMPITVASIGRSSVLMCLSLQMYRPPSVGGRTMLGTFFRFMTLITLTSWTVMAQTVYFTDIGSDTMKVGNTSYYEVGFRKSNGGIAYIIDKSTGRSVTLGSRYQELWGAQFRNPSAVYKGAGSYSPSGQDRFSYNWNSATGILTMQYTPSASAQRKFTVMVEVIGSASNYFDIRARFQNAWGDTITTFQFPLDLVLKESDIKEVLIPPIPGVILNSNFFAKQQSYSWRYPGGGGMISDFMSFNLQAGRFAMYAVYDTSATPYVNLSLWHDDQYIAGSTVVSHSFDMYLPSGTGWVTPRTRIRVGVDHPAAINALRIDSGIDQLASIQNKYGSYFDRVSKAPLIKCGFLELQTSKRRKFADFDTLIATLPVPSILHPVGFEMGGFEMSYPDVLPPDTSLGTTADYQAFYRRTQGRGVMIMPYTNPTWWTDKSPTILNLSSSGLSLSNICVLSVNHRPSHQIFDAFYGGYVVSPRQPFVRDRLAQLVSQLTSDLPSDMLFQDQIGARTGPLDFNPASPTPFSYIDGWVEHSQLYKQKRLATERGFDRLIESHVSFHGSIRLDELSGNADSQWGKGNWDYYPLVPMLAGDKVLLYQHDLDYPEAITTRDNLRWDLTFGFMHTYDLADGRFHNPEWLNVAGDFQFHVASRYAGKRLKQYTTIQPRVTRSVFDGISVVSNWDTTGSVSLGTHTLSPGGVLVQADDGSLTAGIFSAYNGQMLTPTPPNDHYIIVDRSVQGDSLNVMHWLGGDTPFHLERPTFWPASAVIRVFAVAKNATIEVSKTVTTSAIDFTLAKSVQGQAVLRYVVTSTAVAASVPTLTSPPDSSTNMPSNTTLTWGSAIGAVSYHLQLSATSAFTSTVVNDSSLGTTSRAVSSLSLSTTYYWRVRSKNSNGTSAWSVTRSFTTVASAPQPPTLAAPADSAGNVSVSPTLSWNASSGASSYRLQVGTNPSFPSPLVDDSTITATSRQIGPLTNNTKFYWRMNVKNAGGTSPWSVARSFTTVSSAPQPPALAAPADSAQRVSISPIVSWNASTGATSYRLQVGTNPSFPTPLFDDSTITATSRQIGPLTNNTKFYWRMNAKSSGGTSSWSMVRSFTTVVSAPLPPSLAAPVDSARNVQLNTTLIWNAATTATIYHLQLSTASDYSATILYDSSLTTTSRVIGPLSLATTYYWRVRAKNDGGYSAFSSTRQFSTMRTTSVEQSGSGIPTEFALDQNYPNPFNPATTIHFAVPKGGPVSLKVYDLLGREVATLVSQELGAGYFTVRWQAEVASGTYVYRLQAGEFVESKKMILLH